jgi:hypothetical protein
LDNSVEISTFIDVTAKSKAQVHLELLEEDKSSAGTQACKLIAEGIKIEETQ